MIVQAKKIYNLEYRGSFQQIKKKDLIRLNDSLGAQYRTASPARKRKIIEIFYSLNRKYLEAIPFNFLNPMDREDWVSIMKTLLPHALEKYEITKGHLHTYVVGWKHAAFARWQDERRSVRVPVNQRLVLYRLERKLRAGGELTEKEQRIYDSTKIEVSSLSSTLSEGGSELQDVLVGEDPRKETGMDTNGKLWERIEVILTPEDFQILKWKHHPDNPLTLREIGEKVGLSHERIRQKLERILTRLRKNLNSYSDWAEEL